VKIKHLDLKSSSKRIVLLASTLALIVSALFVARWGIGSAIAEQSQSVALFEMAANYSPHDPFIPQEEAQLWLRSPMPGDERKVVAAFERAVSLSPNDYRLWLALGQALERSGEAVRGEKALRQAVILAPAYSMPRWQLGNFLLRQGRLDEAFAELQKAGESLPSLRPQIISLAWQAYGKDFAAVSRALGNGPAMRAAFVKFLTQSNRLDEAFAIWTALSDAERREQKEIGKELMDAFAKSKRWRNMWRLNSQLNNENIAPNAILNPGFEEDIRLSGNSYFGWQIAEGAQPQIVIDGSERRAGYRSLILAFASTGGLEFRNVSQIVLVEASSRYRLEYFYRVADLTTISSVKLEVVDAADEASVLASSAPVPTGSQDWQQVRLDFSTQPKTEAILVRLVRAPCAEGNCPIVGKVWYDDFSLQRSN
jgi:hypothetical protein